MAVHFFSRTRWDRMFTWSGEVTPRARTVPPRRLGRLRERAEPVLAAVVFALFARTFLFQAFVVPSPSMEKNVLTGDRLLVNKFVLRHAARPARRRSFPSARCGAATSSSSAIPKIRAATS